MIETFKNMSATLGDCEIVIMSQRTLGPVHFYGPIDGKVFLCDYEYLSKKVLVNS